MGAPTVYSGGGESAGMDSSIPLASSSGAPSKISPHTVLQLCFVRWGTSLLATALLPSSSCRCLHLSNKATLVDSCLSSRVGSPYSFSTRVVGVDWTIPKICLAALSCALFRFCQMVMEIHAVQAGAAFSVTLHWVAWHTVLMDSLDQPQSAPVCLPKTAPLLCILLLTLATCENVSWGS